MKQGTDLQALQKQLADGAKLGDDARADLAKSLEQKQLALQHAAENAEADYSRERAEIIGRVLKKMAPVLDKFAKDNGFSMILDARFWPAGHNESSAITVSLKLAFCHLAIDLHQPFCRHGT